MIFSSHESWILDNILRTEPDVHREDLVYALAIARSQGRDLQQSYNLVRDAREDVDEYWRRTVYGRQG